MDTLSTSLNLSLVGPTQVLSTSPTSSTIVSVSKTKDVSTEVKQNTPLKFLLTGKVMDEDIDLDKEIFIPKIDLDTAIADEMRLVSQLLKQKAR